METKKIELEKLKEPFYSKDIEWRISRYGKAKETEKNPTGIWAKAIVYIQSRAIHDRLDEVCGPENWQMRYKEHKGGTVCEIGIKLDGEWIWKCGGAGDTKVESFKGGLSDSEKRAGVPWGIGRYLYKLDEEFINVIQTKRPPMAEKADWKYQKGNANCPDFYWKPPVLPDWARPKDEYF